MSMAYQVVVCGGIVPDPLQTLEPVTGPDGPALKNEMMLPAVLVIAGRSDVDVKRIANPQQVLLAILRMEHEYLASIGIIAALVAIWGILAFLFGLIPFAGHVLAVAMSLYVVIAGGLVVGRLQSRFSEQLR